MNHLRNIIRGIESPDLKKTGNEENISSLLARVEQVIYDRLSLNREISDVDGAKKLLTRLHSSEAGSFDEYMDSLHNLKSEDKFSIALEDLMSEVAKSDNPAKILLALVEEERGSGLVTEQNILPALFFVEDETEEMRAFRKMVAANPDLKATLITRKLAQLGKKATWVAPKPEYQGSGFKPSEPIWNAADTQQVWDEAFSEWKNMSPAEQRTATRAATRAVQNEAELAIQMRGRAIMEEPVGKAGPVTEWLPKDTPPIAPGEIELTTWPLMGGPETGWNLNTWDYQRIREYFAGEKPFSNLSPKQGTLVESLRYTPEQFDAAFSPTGDTAMFHELRTQLKSELLADGIVSSAEMNAFVGIDERFAVSAEEFGPHFAISKGTEVSMNPDPWAIPDINAPVPPQLVPDRGLEEYTLARDQFQEEPRVPVEAAPEPPQRAPPVKRYRTEAEVRADISDLTEDYEPWRPDDVERMQVLMDELEEIHFIPDRGLGPIGRDPFPDLEAPSFRDWDYSKESQESWGGDRETAWGLSDEDAALLGRMEGPQTSTALTEEQLGVLLDGMTEANGGIEVRANVAFSQSGEILIEQSFLKKFAMKQVKNLAAAPLVMALVNLISQGDQAVSNYISVGLGVYDVLASGALGVFGLAASVLGVMLGEFNIKAQAKIDNEHPDKYRGRHFGFVKIGAEWRPAVVWKIHKDTTVTSRDAILTMEYGDTDDLVWVQSGTGAIQPFFMHPHSIDYEVYESEMEGEQSTKSYISGTDMTRNWYFLDGEEREALTQSTRTDADFQFEAYNIKEGMNAYERSLEDVRQAAEIMTGFGFDAAERQTGAEPEYYADFPSDRSLRNSGHLSVLGAAAGDWDEWAWARNQRANASDAMNNWTSDDLAGMFKDKENTEYRFDSPIFPENQFILDTWHTSLTALIVTQRLAATNAEWNKYFPPGSNEKRVAANPTASYYGPTAQINMEQTPFSAMYTLPEYEFPTALDAGTLRTQKESIDALDIPRVDRDFLTNKAINRYWINQITSRGGADALVELTNSDGPAGLGHDAERKNTPQAWLTNDFSEVAPDMLGEEQFDSGESAGWKRYMGMRMPWNNTDDIGMFPEDLGYLELSPENEAKDFQYEGYSKEILHRFEVTKESVDTTGERPDYTAMEYNPENYYSTMYLPGQEPRFSSLKPSGPTLFLPEEHNLFPSDRLLPPEGTGRTYRHPEHREIYASSAGVMKTEFSRRNYELYTETIPFGQTEPIGSWKKVKSSSNIEGTTFTRIEFVDGSTIEVENEQDVRYRVSEEAVVADAVPTTIEPSAAVPTKKPVDWETAEPPYEGWFVENDEYVAPDGRRFHPNDQVNMMNHQLFLGNVDQYYFDDTWTDAEIARNISVGGPTIEPTEDDFIQHFEENVDIQYNDEGKPTGLTFEGEHFPLDKLMPELAEEAQETTPDTFDLGESDEPLQQLREFLKETNREMEPEMLTPEGVPFVAWDESTRLPTLGGDEGLHDRLKMPYDTQVVMSSNGVVHAMFNPFLHGIPTEGISHD